MLPALTVPIKEWSLGLESEAAYWRLMTASGWVFRARNNSTTNLDDQSEKLQEKGVRLQRRFELSGWIT